MSRIAAWDYRDEYAAHRDAILAAVDRVFASGQLILGSEVMAFERDFAAYCGAAYALGVDNDTNALVLALQALGIGAGDEVITVANTVAPTVVAIRNADAIARFVDIDPDSYLMDTDALAATVSPRTRAIIPVHLSGSASMWTRSWWWRRRMDSR